MTQAMPRRRILFLASYFPKPDNPLMGTWALKQAQALARRDDVELLTVSFTSWVPKALAQSKGAKAYADCPPEHTWPGGVRVLYPRWLYYPIGPIRRLMHRHPGPFMALAAWSARRKFRKICADFKPDALFCHHSLPNGHLAMQEAEKRGIPLVITEHDFGEVEDCSRLPARGRAFARVGKAASALVAINRRMADALKRAAPDAKVSILYNGVDLPPPHLRQNPKPAETSGKRVILCVALFAQRKGVPLLVEAFAQAAQSHPDAVLRIVGSGPDEPAIRAAISRLGLADRVQMAGRKSPEEVLQEMAWADCFALFGWDEPFATVYLEAMSVGTPVLCCSDGGICDVLKHGEHGLHAAPKDAQAAARALGQALADPLELRRMGENGRKLVEAQLTWEANTGRLADLLLHQTP